MPISTIFRFSIFSMIFALFMASTASSAGLSCSAIFEQVNVPSVEKIIRLPSKQKLFSETRILDPNKPTFVFLPGLYRGLNKLDAVYKYLIESDMNWVLLHFSVHPKSLLDAGSDVPRNLSLQELASEMQGAIAELNIKKPLVVTLSYSGSLGSFFHSTANLPVLETGPIGKYNEELGAAGGAAEAWANSVRKLPGGAQMIRAIQDSSYQSYWSEITLGMTATDVRILRPLNFAAVTSGYVKMARAIEGYDIKQVKWNDQSTRYFLLGELENPERLKNQKLGIMHYWNSTGIRPYVVLAQDGQHNLAQSNPVGYLEFLKLVAESKLDPQVAGGFMTTDGKINPWSEADLKNFLNK